MDDCIENVLFHYGIKGMKWGVRRYQPYNSGGYKRIKKSISSTPVSKMENKEASVEMGKLFKMRKKYKRKPELLKPINNRLKEYDQLRKSDSRKEGKAFARNLKTEAEKKQALKWLMADLKADKNWKKKTGGSDFDADIAFANSAILELKKSLSVSHSDIIENTLIHYGIKGMKWGVRRFQPYSSGNKRPRARKLLSKKDDKTAKIAGLLGGPVVGGAVAAVKYKQQVEKKSRITKEYKKMLKESNKSFGKIRNKLLSGKATDKDLAKFLIDATTISNHYRGLGDIKKADNVIDNFFFYSNFYKAAKHQDIVSNVLIHYGVKGMRWGYRKSQERKGHSAAAKSTAMKRNKKRDPTRMTDKKLKTVVDRKKLEKEYKNVMTSDVEKAVKKVLMDSSTKLATEFIVKSGSKGIEVLLNKK